MARRRLLGDEQWAALFALPTGERDVVRYCTLTPDDLALVAAKRSPPNRLGYALLLCALCHPGRALEPRERPPAPMVRLCRAPTRRRPRPSWLPDPTAPRTRREQLAELMRHGGFQGFGRAEARDFVAWLTPVTQANRKPGQLAGLLVEELRRRRILAAHAQGAGVGDPPRPHPGRAGPAPGPDRWDRPGATGRAGRAARRPGRRRRAVPDRVAAPGAGLARGSELGRPDRARPDHARDRPGPEPQGGGAVGGVRRPRQRGLAHDGAAPARPGPATACGDGRRHRAEVRHGADRRGAAHVRQAHGWPVPAERSARPSTTLQPLCATPSATCDSWPVRDAPSSPHGRTRRMQSRRWIVP